VHLAEVQVHATHCSSEGRRSHSSKIPLWTSVIGTPRDTWAGVCRAPLEPSRSPRRVGHRWSSLHASNGEVARTFPLRLALIPLMGQPGILGVFAVRQMFSKPHSAALFASTSPRSWSCLATVTKGLWPTARGIEVAMIDFGKARACSGSDRRRLAQAYEVDWLRMLLRTTSASLVKARRPEYHIFGWLGEKQKIEPALSQRCARPSMSRSGGSTALSGIRIQLRPTQARQIPSSPIKDLVGRQSPVPSGIVLQHGNPENGRIQ
jgi:hypothetical protein